MIIDTLFNPKLPSVIEDPYKYYEQYRNTDPVHFGVSLHKELEGTWYLFNYKDINQVLKSKNFVRTPPREEIELVPPIYRSFKSVISKWLVFQDPPEHTRIRSVLNNAFSGRSLKNMEAIIESITLELLEKIEQKNEIEFISEFALPLPIRVICKILGISSEDSSKFEELSLALLAASFSVDRKNEDVFALAEKSMQEFIEYFTDVISKKANNLEDDLISLMIESGIDDKLNKEEIISNCIHILNAGFETTINLIAKGTHALQSNRKFYVDFKKESNDYKALAEELLRYDNPVQMVTRWVTETFSISGKTIEKGSQIALMLGASNRDSQIFENPDTLVLHRKKMHLSFGGGIHYCLGSALARLEAKVAFRHLDTIIVNYELDDKRDKAIVWGNSIVFHGFRELWLRKIDRQVL
ncbi:cytochrome P450 [Aquimarina sp. RZ0]|uniref:cytochrome P450 n=1 Tax=Aquimarina sp. RZ0 TaxID=2607730 RepID=UPI0011F327A9|nr:cytochrome P450 [Aquimarina sp. RZ0]KAA1247022.1 cytochrome P450 [Aquimarina sp. RZ0]